MESRLCVKNRKKPENTKTHALFDYVTAEFIEKLLRKQWIYIHNTDIDEGIFHHSGLRERDGPPREAWSAWKELNEAPYQNE